jgi:hypothetical protein
MAENPQKSNSGKYLILLILFILTISIMLTIIINLPKKNPKNFKVEKLELDFKEENLAGISLKIKNTGREKFSNLSISVFCGEGNSVVWKYNGEVDFGEVIETEFGGGLWLGGDSILVKVNNEEVYSKPLSKFQEENL